jgi:hypothetical protein
MSKNMKTNDYNNPTVTKRMGNAMPESGSININNKSINSTSKDL